MFDRIVRQAKQLDADGIARAALDRGRPVAVAERDGVHRTGPERGVGRHRAQQCRRRRRLCRPCVSGRFTQAS